MQDHLGQESTIITIADYPSFLNFLLFLKNIQNNWSLGSCKFGENNPKRRLLTSERMYHFIN